jgi:SNF2 family DNA or RNA helicase
MLPRYDWLKKTVWDILILDEAQAIKIRVPDRPGQPKF